MTELVIAFHAVPLPGCIDLCRNNLAGPPEIQVCPHGFDTLWNDADFQIESKLTWGYD